MSKVKTIVLFSTAIIFSAIIGFLFLHFILVGMGGVNNPISLIPTVALTAVITAMIAVKAPRVFGEIWREE